MLQVYLVRHGETVWNAARRIQGQSDSPLTEKGEQQAHQVGERVKSLGITHVIASDLGRTRRTAEIIADACGCTVTLDARLRELNMGCLEQRPLDGLTEEEENWRKTLVDGTTAGRIPGGESMAEMAARMHEALNALLELPAGSRPLIVSHGMALGVLVSTILGLPAHAERRLRLRNCSISRVDHQQSAWLAAGWVVETAGDVSHLDAPALDELQR
ncbi:MULTISPECIES: 2,3-diphosphoglycerate-dependent phosphoglycerate mutase GpmB [Enterobacterales]|jgi:probable phosphoglycerate mutase|uniref:Probable phosphoglycerate mutase GpmB n=1 Tax=Pantoea trifolii TaxID=2968030 RepID=A0ABT1VIP7_9GAMM|nr:MULTISPECIES: 2,3-diphosphoglycerate-dependent phosphoglycerate mutase GpmB [Enterobacterales]MDY0927475.1 2,3-diphosphoglycerate-dependent phosphoglycerate mutase GpmB [Enterobacter sp. CFBP8995]MRS20171.1 phosphoglycerate mutase GpmB [Enterobacteriaceae bacterium RIT692]MRT40917.1 phosphoglycerate mutase GpmB [Enterobacteriaceae bacterium RIT702]MBB3305823.1 putative phosphoglycerate mutase [Enterobacter sp. Sphag1F]MCQ8226489.1 2,3-diphosphoglycerate-dependent phosphoglycerate mutase Gpm